MISGRFHEDLVASKEVYVQKNTPCILVIFINESHLLNTEAEAEASTSFDNFINLDQVNTVNSGHIFSIKPHLNPNCCSGLDA